ncbi:MAG TPA: hypothetical protein PLN69_10970 [bacterium]|nr:hypothetical protein [bacterium]
MREALLQVQTEMMYAGMIGAMKLPDPVLAAAISRFRKIAVALAGRDDEEFMMRLAELEEYFGDRSPLSGALRKMILDARPSQMKSMIRGYLVNYIYEL